jgi:hypothetical protein
MANNKRYRDLEQYMTIALIASAVIFVLYLIFSAAGVIWLKVITAIFAILLPLLSMAILYLTQELLRQRSLWLTTGFFGVFICTLVSLIANFPAP